MKFILREAKDWERKEEIEVNTIEDLKNLSTENGGNDLILNFHDEIPEILIYNDYIE